MSEQRAPYDTAALTPDDFGGILGDVPNLPEGWKYPARGESAPAADRVAALRYKIDNQRQTLARMQLQYDKMKANAEKLARDLRERDLTLATLCDMVLGEDAADRSDDALVRAVGMLKREHDKLRAELEAVQAKLSEYEGGRWHSFETVQAIKKERDATILKCEAALKQAQIANAGRAQAEAERDAANKFVASVRSWAYYNAIGDHDQVEALEEEMMRLANEPDAPDPLRDALDYIKNLENRAEQVELDVARLLELFRRQAIRSFIAGAGNAYFGLRGKSLSPTDREFVANIAERRFPYVAESFRSNDDIVSEYTALVEKYGGAK